MGHSQELVNPDHSLNDGVVGLGQNSEIGLLGDLENLAEVSLPQLQWVSCHLKVIYNVYRIGV